MGYSVADVGPISLKTTIVKLRQIFFTVTITLFRRGTKHNACWEDEKPAFQPGW